MLHDIYFSSSASWLPEKLTPVKEGLKTAEFSQKDFARMGYESIAIAPAMMSVDTMAVTASHQAMMQADIKDEELVALTFNGFHDHGHPQFWSPSCYLPNEFKTENALPLSIYQGYNGQLLSISLLSQLLQTSKKSYALSVAADQVSLSGVNRWHDDGGIIYGDGAAAVVLSNTSGIAKIISLNTVNAVDLEGSWQFAPVFSSDNAAISDNKNSSRAAEKSSFNRHSQKSFDDTTQQAITTLWDMTFSDNSLVPEDIRYFIFPNLSEEVLDKNYFFVYPQAKERSLWHFGKTIGHLTASDAVVGLDYLFKNDLLVEGDKVLCIGSGAGMSWTCLVIEKL